VRESELRAQLAAAHRDVQNVQKATKSAESGTSAMDVRLSRATEEMERIRNQMQSERSERVACEQDLKSKNEALTSQVKRIERQRSELLLAFKKQMKLIDVLKRQRIHVSCEAEARIRITLFYLNFAPFLLFRLASDGSCTSVVFH
jgi:hypothetical protein